MPPCLSKTSFWTLVENFLKSFSGLFRRVVDCKIILQFLKRATRTGEGRNVQAIKLLCHSMNCIMMWILLFLEKDKQTLDMNTNNVHEVAFPF